MVVLATWLHLSQYCMAAERHTSRIPPGLVPTFANMPSDCPWLPRVIRIQEKRLDHQLELRRQYFRQKLVARYFAAAPSGSPSHDQEEKIAIEVADFLYDVRTELSAETLAFNESILARPPADLVARVIAMRIGRQTETGAPNNPAEEVTVTEDIVDAGGVMSAKVADISDPAATVRKDGEATEPVAKDPVNEEEAKEATKRFEQQRLALCQQILATESDPFVRLYIGRTGNSITSWAGAWPDREQYKKYTRIMYLSFLDCLDEMDCKEPERFLMAEWMRFYIYSNIDFRRDKKNFFARRYLASLFAERSEVFRRENAAFIGTFNGDLALAEAWEVRGGGWASEVPPDKWPIFNAKLAEAAEWYEAGYRASPQSPYAPAGMIAVAMAGKGGEKRWFERGVAACFDHFPLYTAMLWSLRPRWGGSHGEMLIFGGECLNTRRFDTWVPNYLTVALFDVASESSRRWRGLFRLPPVKKALVELYEGYIEASARTSLNDDWLAMYSLAMFLCGDYAEAKRLYETLPASWEEDGKRRNYGVDWLWEPYTFGQLPKAVELFLDERGDKLREADEAETHGDLARAAALFTEALSSFPGDPAAATYLRRRLGECLFWRDYKPKDVAAASYTWKWMFQSKGGDETPAILIASHGLTEALSHLLENGQNPDGAHGDGYPLLYFAIKNKHAESVSLLLAHGADANLRAGGAPLVQYAIEADSPEIVRAMLENGADLKAVSDTGRNALYIAAVNNSLAVLPFLDGMDFDVNLRSDDTGFTPLYNAANKGFAEMTEYLLGRGADPDIPVERGFTPMHAAASNGYAEVVELLARNGANLEAIQDNGATPLAEACSKGRLDVMEALLRHGADPDVLLKTDAPPLVGSAVAYKNDAMLTLLLRHGASPDKMDSRGVSPLLAAVYYKNANAIDILLNSGADINTPSVGMLTTPLHMAVEDGDMGIFNKVVDAGPFLDPRDVKGNTPLLLAAGMGRADMAKLLSDRGADVLVWNSSRLLPSQVARRAGHEELASFLLRNEAKQAGIAALPYAAVTLALLTAIILWRRRRRESNTVA